MLRFKVNLSAAFTTDARVHLAKKIHDILAPCTHPLHTSPLDRIIKEIKLMKRIAYSFRHDQYFFLKIRALLPIHLGYASKQGEHQWAKT